MGGRVATSHEVEQLALDVSEQTACAEAEEVGHHPLGAELLLHERQPRARVLRSANAACWLEANLRKVTKYNDVFQERTSDLTDATAKTRTTFTNNYGDLIVP